MAFYELVFIMRGDLSPEAASGLGDGYQKVIKESGGKVQKSEQWGLLPLAYPIKKNKKGHYFLLQLDAPHEAVAELERRMKLDEDNLRFLTTRIDEISKEDSVFLSRHKEKQQELVKQEAS